MGKDGWTFLAEDGATGDTLYGLDFLHQIYTKADPAYTGRVTVPVLWDRQEETIVSNKSPEIIRMLNSAFNEWGDASLDFYPEASARRDRPGQRAGLPVDQQRRLPDWFRDDAGGL